MNYASGIEAQRKKLAELRNQVGKYTSSSTVASRTTPSNVIRQEMMSMPTSSRRP